MIFEIDNIELNFSGRNVLNGIYLKAETGKVTGLLGTNGSGKSCLFELFFGSMKAKYKLVRVDSNPLTKPLFKTKKVKFLPQFNFIPNSVKLSVVFELYKVNWESFVTVFESFIPYRNSKFKELSGGERRILETYLVIKSDSEFILLDEPFSHLSPININLFKRLIAEEKKNKAVVITDHMYNHIIDASDDIYLLKNGTTKLIKNLEELEMYRYISEGSLGQTANA